jgi:uncharacterized protein YlxW (UPF0749 family)
MTEPRPPEENESTGLPSTDAPDPAAEPAGSNSPAAQTDQAGESVVDSADAVDPGDESDATDAAQEPATEPSPRHEPDDQVGLDGDEPTAPEPADATSEPNGESEDADGDEAGVAAIEAGSEPDDDADSASDADAVDADAVDADADVDDGDEDTADTEARSDARPVDAPPDQRIGRTEPEPADEANESEPPAAARPPRQRLAVRYRAAALIGALVAALGFAIAVQVHANSQADSLSNLRADDLIGILDNQNARGDRLRQQINELQQTLRRLRDSGDRNAAAQQQAEQDAQALGVLLGTLPATGPGVIVAITDPNRKLQAEDLLDVVEELRGAGAEAIQFGSVRVSTATSFTNKDGAVAVDGAVQLDPYTVRAIGDPTTLDTALNIPGGVAAAVRAAGGELTVSEQDTVTIKVTRGLPTPKYASPSSH